MSAPADEYLIAFDTKIHPGKVQAVRVRIDVVTLENHTTEHRVDLCNHPLYLELRQYVEANKQAR